MNSFIVIYIVMVCCLSFTDCAPIPAMNNTTLECPATIDSGSLGYNEFSLQLYTTEINQKKDDGLLIPMSMFLITSVVFVIMVNFILIVLDRGTSKREAYYSSLEKKQQIEPIHTVYKQSCQNLFCRSQRCLLVHE